MCIIALAYKTPALGPLVLLANRDEYYRRPAAPLDYWQDAPQTLGGRDLQAGGSWLAIDTRGRLAAVTHIRDGRPQSQAARSRGELVQRFVTGDEDALSYAQWLREHRHEFGPFNLLFGSYNDLLHFSSRSGQLNRLNPGIHVLSNADMDTPWFKSERLRGHLQALRRPPAEAEVLPWLCDRTAAEVAELPNTGVGLALEKLLSPVFIVGRDYGTRASSLLTVTARGDVGFAEVSWDMSGRETGRRRYQFLIGKPRSTV